MFNKVNSWANQDFYRMLYCQENCGGFKPINCLKIDSTIYKLKFRIFSKIKYKVPSSGF